MRLELIGAKGYLGCPFDVCDLRTCPIGHHKNFAICTGEGFQIIGEGGGSIKSGQRVRFRFVREGNTWLGCPLNYCDKRLCPGEINSVRARNFDTCWGEVFRIYACGRNNGHRIQNGDLVMIYFPEHPHGKGKGYISIQGSSEGADTSLSLCPGNNSLTPLRYSLCSNNVFRIHRKP